MELALKIINHDTVSMSVPSESDITAKVGKWVKMLQLITSEEAAEAAAIVCRLLKDIEGILLTEVRNKKDEAESNAEKEGSIQRAKAKVKDLKEKEAKVKDQEDQKGSGSKRKRKG